MQDDRYAGKPLLIVLDNYVLDCMGHFPKEKEPAMTVIVQRVFGGGEDWKATIRAVLHLEESLDENLREMWEKNQTIAEQSGKVLTPIEFAYMVVDENFASLLD